jgi:formylglycine-generating enzyme required for sulfatase activity
LHDDLRGVEFWNTKDQTNEDPNLAVYTDQSQISYVYSGNFITVELLKVPFTDGTLRATALGDLTQDGRGNFWVVDSGAGSVLWLQWNRSKELLEIKRTFNGFDYAKSITYFEPNGLNPALILAQPGKQALVKLEPFTGAIIKENRLPLFNTTYDVVTSWNPFWPTDTNMLADNSKVYASFPNRIYEISPVSLEPIRIVYQRNADSGDAFYPRHLEVTATGLIVAVDILHSQSGIISPDNGLIWLSSGTENSALQVPGIWQNKVIMGEDIRNTGRGWEIFQIAGFYHENPIVSNLWLDKSTVDPGTDQTIGFSVNGRCRVQIKMSNSLRTFVWKDTLILNAGAQSVVYPQMLPVDGEWIVTVSVRGIKAGNQLQKKFSVAQKNRMVQIGDTIINGVEIPGFFVYKTELTNLEKDAYTGIKSQNTSRPAGFISRSSGLVLVDVLNKLSGHEIAYDNQKMDCIVWSLEGDCALSSNATSSHLPGYRLPSIREWQRLAPPATSSLDNYAWYSANSGGTLHDAGLKSPNSLGLYDLYGNIPELLEDQQFGFTSLSLFRCYPTSGYLKQSVHYPFLGLYRDPVLSGIQMGGGYLSDSSHLGKYPVQLQPSEITAYSSNNVYVSSDYYMGMRPIARFDTLKQNALVTVATLKDTVLPHKTLDFILNKNKSSRVFVRLVSPLGHRMPLPGFEDLVWNELGSFDETKSWRIIDSGQTHHVIAFIPDCPGRWIIQAAKASSRPEWSSDTFWVNEDENLLSPVNGLRVKRHEVTQGDYWSVMGHNPSYYQGNTWGQDWSRPVERVSFFQSAIYLNLRSWISGYRQPYKVTCTQVSRIGECEQAIVVSDSLSNGFRLPAQTEWDAFYNADSITGLPWPSDSTGNLYAWYNLSSSYPTQPIGQLRSTSGGLFDLAGNVYEWVWGGDSINGILKGGGKWSAEKFLKGTYNQTAVKNSKGIYGFRYVQKETDYQTSHQVLVVNGFGGGLYRAGDTVTIAPKDSTAQFLRWTGNTEVFSTAATTSWHRFVMPDRAIVLTPVWTSPNASHQLTVVNGSGSGSYPEGSNVCVSATIPDGKHFVEWGGDGLPGVISNLAQLCFNMPSQDWEIEAVIADPTPQDQRYELVVVGGEGSGLYPFGALATLSFQQNDRQFLKWAAEDSTQQSWINDSQMPVTKVLVQGNVKISAQSSFIQPPSLMHLNVSGGLGSGDYLPGTFVPIVPEPLPSMKFMGWMISNSKDQYFIAGSGGIYMPNIPTSAAGVFSPINNGPSNYPTENFDGLSPLSTILDFENATDWFSSSFSLSENSSSKTGNNCLCTTVGGYGTLRSIPFNSTLLGPAGDSISLSLKVKENPPNPWWLGTVKMQFVFPSSARTFNLGEVTLSSNFISQWKELTWMIPTEMKQLLEYESKDVRIELTLNGNGHVLCLDHFVLWKGNTTIRPWPDACSGIGCTAQQPIDLGVSNQPTIVTVPGQKWFTIKSLAFPGWTPSKIKIQANPKENSELTGTWIQNGKETTMDGWTNTLAIPYEGQSDLSIAIKNIGVRQYEIRWWAE